MMRYISFICVIALAIMLGNFSNNAQAQMPLQPKLAVSCYLGDCISMIDARTIRSLNQFSVGGYPEKMVLSPDGKYMIVTQPKKNCISVVDVASLKFGAPMAGDVLSSPWGPCFSPDSARLYMVNSEKNILVEIHVPSFNVIRTLDLPTGGPKYTICNKVGSALYIAHPEKGDVTVVDVASWSVKKTVHLASVIGELAFSPDYSKILVALPTTNRVGIYKTADFSMLTAVPVGQGAEYVKVSPKGQVVVINTISNDVSTFDLKKPSGRYRIMVGMGPIDAIFSPDGTSCFVVNYNSNDISVINMAKGEQLGRLSVGKGPRSIVWLPR